MPREVDLVEAFEVLEGLQNTILDLERNDRHDERLRLFLIGKDCDVPIWWRDVGGHYRLVTKVEKFYRPVIDMNAAWRITHCLDLLWIVSRLEGK